MTVHAGVVGAGFLSNDDDRDTGPTISTKGHLIPGTSQRRAGPTTAAA